MKQRLTRAELQSWNNFVCVLRYFSLDDYCNLMSVSNIVRPDRIIVDCNPDVEIYLDHHPDFSRDKLFLKSEHPGAYASWRQNVTTYSIQLCLIYNGSHKLEVDCDYGRPFYDVVGWVVHGYEFVANKLFNKYTNPFKVREVLNKRGYNIPLVKEA